MNQRIAIVTPSFARDFILARDLNESVMRYMPPDSRHYLIVDGRDLKLFRQLKNSRTVIVSVEDVLPWGFFKVSRRWWVGLQPMMPARGWLVQQLVKLSATKLVEEPVIVNVDSDVRFIRSVDTSMFVKAGRVRMYRQSNGIVPGMIHEKWHNNICKLLGVQPDSMPPDDYVGNVISWNRQTIVDACKRIETITGRPWYIDYTRYASVSEYLMYGLFVDKVIGQEAAGVWVDERSWCHTYWGPAPLNADDVDTFVAQLRDDDVAFSIAGYTDSAPEVIDRALKLVIARSKA